MTRGSGSPPAVLAILTALVACGDSAPPGGTRQLAHGIVTLAPHLAELVFAAGAGDILVGVSAHTDHPPAAAGLDVVSDAFTVDQEQLALAAPALVLAWQSGTPRHVVDELRAAGYRVEAIETRGLGDVASALRTIGRLTGREATAEAAALEFEAALDSIAASYKSRRPVSVFYQVSMRPLYTISGDHYISEIVSLCGGQNVFAELDDLAPSVSVEAVLARDPQVLLAGSDDGSMPFSEWSRWPRLAANRYGNLFVVDADAIGRPSLRLVDAALAVCTHLETARERLSDAASPAAADGPP